LNKIKGDSTSVSDLISYENKKGLRNISQNNIVGVFKNRGKFVEEMKKNDLISIIPCQINNIEYKSFKWIINFLRDDKGQE
jgi:hypothetical protein